MRGPIEVADNVFAVFATHRISAGVTIQKTMTVLREGNDVVVVNSARVGDDGLKALRALGNVKHLVRLGSGHGSDDAFYLDTFSPTYWAPERAPLRDGRKPDRLLVDGGELPFSGRCFLFEHLKNGEAAVVVDRAQLLITCDALQAWRDTQECSLLGGLSLRAMGFFRAPVIVGRLWKKKQGLPRLGEDFTRLQTLPFRSLIAGHGEFVVDAQIAVAAAAAGA